MQSAHFNREKALALFAELDNGLEPSTELEYHVWFARAMTLLTRNSCLENRCYFAKVMDKLYADKADQKSVRAVFAAAHHEYCQGRLRLYYGLVSPEGGTDEDIPVSTTDRKNSECKGESDDN